MLATMELSMAAFSGNSSWVPRIDLSERAKRAADIVRRSTLIVPGNVERFLKKAHTRGADAVQIDLEDSVPPSEKPSARANARGWIEYLKENGAEVLVRINKPFFEAVKDLDAIIYPGLTGVVFPKCERAEEVIVLDRLIAERELARGMPIGEVQIGVLIESTLGLLNAPAISSASPRIVSVCLGTEDYCLELGVEPAEIGPGLLPAKTYIVAVARAAGVQPLGLVRSIADFSDLDAFKAAAEEARSIGYLGASCIHPDQVPILNQVFSPKPEEVERASRIIAEFAAAEGQGRASLAVDGKMVDIPVVERARLVLRRAEIIRSKKRGTDAAIL